MIAPNKPGFWVVGGGLLQCAMIREAKEMGYEAYVTDGDITAPGFELADHFRLVSTYDSVQHRRHAQEWLDMGANIVGVATCGADVAPTVAAVAEVLRTPGIPMQSAVMSHNKYMVRWQMATASLLEYMPQWRLFHFDGPVTATAQINLLLQEWGGLVIKPLSQRASRGVTICRSEEDVWEGLEAVKMYLVNGDFLVEELLEGTEHSVEIILGIPEHSADPPEPLFFNIVDRPFNYVGGHAIETGHVSPSSLDTLDWLCAQRMIKMAADALGIQWGPFKCDVIWTTDGPKILECTARMSGGFDCQETVRFSNRNPIRQVIQLATNTPVEDIYDLNYSDSWFSGLYGACKASFPPPGRVLALPRENVVSEMSGVEKVIITVQRGSIIQPYRHCAQRPGFVIAKGVTGEDAWLRASAAADVLASEFEVEHVE